MIWFQAALIVLLMIQNYRYMYTRDVRASLSRGMSWALSE